MVGRKFFVKILIFQSVITLSILKMKDIEKIMTHFERRLIFLQSFYSQLLPNFSFDLEFVKHILQQYMSFLFIMAFLLSVFSLFGYRILIFLDGLVLVLISAVLCDPSETLLKRKMSFDPIYKTEYLQVFPSTDFFILFIIAIGLMYISTIDKSERKEKTE